MCGWTLPGPYEHQSATDRQILKCADRMQWRGMERIGEEEKKRRNGDE